MAATETGGTAHGRTLGELTSDFALRTIDRFRRRELPVEGQVLLLVTMGLTAFGQVMVYSASGPLAMTSKAYGNDPLYFVKHGLVFTLIGVFAMLLAMRVPPGWLKLGGPSLLLASTALLLAVLVPGVGLQVNGARRWLGAGPVVVQPSELAKLALLGTVAALLAARKQPPSTVGALLKPIGLVTGVVCVLVLVEPDLGSAIAIAMMVGAMLLVAGTPLGPLTFLGTVATALAGAAVWAEPYRRQRFLAFLDPWQHPHGASYQIVQGIIGAASGGLGGVGLGGSVQKVYYLPEAHTDMIFAIIGEELGLFGSLLVLGGFAAFAWAGFTIALRTEDRFMRLVAAGGTALIAGQAAINTGAVLGILPLTGIPLPLISYGSSSKVVTLLVVGILLAICREGAPQGARRRAG
jgi:cell division protein FtsW